MTPRACRFARSGAPAGPLRHRVFAESDRPGHRWVLVGSRVVEPAARFGRSRRLLRRFRVETEPTDGDQLAEQIAARPGLLADSRSRRRSATRQKKWMPREAGRPRRRHRAARLPAAPRRFIVQMAAPADGSPQHADLMPERLRYKAMPRNPDQAH
jgi:hypothetical protein